MKNEELELAQMSGLAQQEDNCAENNTDCKTEIGVG